VLIRSRPARFAVAAAVLLTLFGCGSDAESDGTEAATTTEVAETTTTVAAAEPLSILVTNDDGYAAEGIDALVTGLRTLDGVELTVVAPLDQRSGTGGSSTEGDLAVTDVELPSGFEAQAVDGFPADTVRVAVDDQKMTPDLVVSGINQAQNLGPVIDISGTVGAARAAVARGIPGLATSQGTGDPFDYEAAVPFVLDWVTEHRAALASGDEPVDVTNLNVPSCTVGEVRGLADVEADVDGDATQALAPQDCASTVPLDEGSGDVAAFATGYATISTIPDEAA